MLADCKCSWPFLFAQQSWSTRSVERNRGHPEKGEDNPNRKGVAVTWQGLKAAIGSKVAGMQVNLLRHIRRLSLPNKTKANTFSDLMCD